MVAVTMALAWAAPAAAVPGVTPTLSGSAGANGWYRSAVTLRWAVGPEGLTSSSGCEPATVLSDDTPGLTKTCRATYDSGVTMAADVVVKIDKTPPTAVRAVTDAAANEHGWFARPVQVTWTGSDATSGIADCTSTPYAGPDVAGLALTGTCRDAAGNVSAPAPFTLNYDATPPAVTGALPARPADHRGWFLRPVAFAFQGQDAGSGIDACDVVGFAGPDSAAGTVTGSPPPPGAGARAGAAARATPRAPPPPTARRAGGPAPAATAPATRPRAASRCATTGRRPRCAACARSPGGG